MKDQEWPEPLVLHACMPAACLALALALALALEGLCSPCECAVQAAVPLKRSGNLLHTCAHLTSEPADTRLLCLRPY